MTTNGRSGVLLKSVIGAGALGLTVALTLLASGRSTGRESQKVVALESRDLVQDATLDRHSQELTAAREKISDVKVDISALKANQQQILDSQKAMSRQLDTIILRLPVREGQ